MRHWLRRSAQWLAYILTAIAALLLLLWAIRGARPTLDCGILAALRAGNWPAAYTCIDKADFDPLIGLTTLVAGALAAIAARLAKPSPATAAQLQSDQEQRNRREMMRRVREIWIDGVLKHSLYHEVLIAMRLEQRPGVTPWGLARQQPNGSEQLLPTGTDIAAVFAAAHDTLVILGAPGSGKSTELLKLTSALLARCETDPTAPVPVVLNLSTWQPQQQTVQEWMVGELARFYGIPTGLGSAWLAAGKLTWMLDGLDELAGDSRDAAVAALNAFLRPDNTLTVPLAVCCREQEYAALKQPVAAAGAVRVLPLTGEQVQNYLHQVGGNESAMISSLLLQDTDLCDLAESPLMLNVMILSAKELRGTVVQGQVLDQDARPRVFDAYVRTMLKRDRTSGLHSQVENKRNAKQKHTENRSAEYSAIETVKWLQWLANKMTLQEEVVLLLERMGRAWLRDKDWYICRAGVSLLYASVFGLCWALYFELILGLFDIGQFCWFRPSSITWLRDWSLYWPGRSPFQWSMMGLIAGLTLGFGIGLMASARDVYVTEHLGIRRRSRRFDKDVLFRTLWMTIISGLLFGFLYGLSHGPANGLIFGLMIGLFCGIFFWWRVERLVPFTSLEATYETGAPNAGIQQSFRNGLYAATDAAPPLAIMTGLAIAAVSAHPRELSYLLYCGLLNSVLIGLVLGLELGLMFGIHTFVMHYLIRLILWSHGSLPFRYVRFLNYCTDRILLRRVGGGYMFIHRTFQDYMATVDAARVTADLDTDRT